MTKYFIFFFVFCALMLLSFTQPSQTLLYTSVYTDYDSTEYKAGKNLYNRNCAICHSLKEIDMVGPALLNIEKKRSRKWIIDFVLDESFRKTDTAAITVKKKYGNAEHPDYRTELKKEDVILILNYINRFQK